MKKIVTVIGARPQFIKASPVSRAIAGENNLHEVILHTGQHFDKNMSQVFFDQMEMARPNHHLNIHSLSHGAMTGRMLEGIELILKQEKPDWVMVYGDTNSTLAGALAASKLRIPLAHVEAGLRSFNTRMPEEINRILTDRVSQLLFCPTLTAMKNLSKEGYDALPCQKIISGDVMYDATLLFKEKARRPLNVALPEKYALATVHRDENTREPERLRNIIKGLNDLADQCPVVFPMHPGTRKLIDTSGLPAFSGNIRVIDPVGYLEILFLLQHCQLVITDSGGMQKEAYFFQKPCITLREETEWTELVKAGYNILCGSDPALILEAFRQFTVKPPPFTGGLYGKGNASEIITKAFLQS